MSRLPPDCRQAREPPSPAWRFPASARPRIIGPVRAEEEDVRASGRERPPLRAVFFDLSETLVHSIPDQEDLLVRACRSFGFDLSARDARRGFLAAGEYWRRAVARLPLEQRTTAQRRTLFAEYDRRALTAAGLRVDRRVALRIFEALLALSRKEGHRLALYQDVRPVLAALKARGLALGVISNLGAELGEVCQALELSPWLDVIVGPGEAGVQKPHPAIFRAALRKVGVPAAAALYVGDQPAVDVAGARRAGLRPVLLDRGDVLSEFTACPRVVGLGQVAELVVGHGSAVGTVDGK